MITRKSHASRYCHHVEYRSLLIVSHRVGGVVTFDIMFSRSGNRTAKEDDVKASIKIYAHPQHLSCATDHVVPRQWAKAGGTVKLFLLLHMFTNSLALESSKS